MDEPKKVAVVGTVMRKYSHSVVLLYPFVEGFRMDHGTEQPRVQIASMYLDQFNEDDRGRAFSEEFGIPLYGSIQNALTLGGDELAVDAVMIIGEHGDYPENEFEQKLYPRRHFMEQVCGVFKESGRSVPTFIDKHLSYNWADAKWMYDRAKELNVPFMAGSSLPVCWRKPWLEHGIGTPIEEALAVGYGQIDAYGFHALEVLQCMLERREGGETGIARVRGTRGQRVWDDAGIYWPLDIAEAVCDRISTTKPGNMEDNCPDPTLFSIDYTDETQGFVLMLGAEKEHVRDFGYGARVGGEVQSTEFFLQPHDERKYNGPFCHFSYYGKSIEEFFLTGKVQVPVERTLKTTGVLETALHSREGNQDWIDTPHLRDPYELLPDVKWRPRGERPSGDTLRRWPAVLE